MFKLPTIPVENIHATSALQVLDEAQIELETAPPSDPELRGTLRQALGKAYLNIGLYIPAESLLAPALSDLEVRGNDPGQRAEMLSDLARISYFQGRYAEAERFAKRALEIQQVTGDSTEAGRYLLGQIAFAKGDFQESERLFREILLRTKAEGEASLSVAGALNDLACVLRERGEIAEARALCERSLAIRKKFLGENHPDVGQSLYNLARLAEEEGKLPTAEDLFRRAHAMRNALPTYHPARPLVLQGLGSFLIDRASYDEASLCLEDSFEDRRAILPDGHPDIARSIAELGRLAHVRGRLGEAEAFYRASLGRLDRVLGANHPDRMSVANNLAALLAEKNRIEEARAIWRDLARRRVAGRFFLKQAVQDNLAASTSVPAGTGKYRTIGTAALDLSAPSSRRPMILRSRPDAIGRPTRILFADDFNDGTLNSREWEFGGSTVSEKDGELHVSVDTRDSGGWARTRPITINPNLPMTISRRVKLHPGNKYFDGSLYVYVIGYPGKRFGVSYANYYNIIGGEVVTVGISLFRAGSNSHRFADRRANASGLLPPIWDRWFDEVLRYDPRTGDVVYSIDGKVRLAYNVGALPPKATSISLDVSSWGWYTGHYHYLDYLRVEQ
jgi:tetratricopeptide (TPR) repeat protein